MSQQNVELTRRAILGWNERGIDALVEALHPEVEFHPPKESMEPGVYRGHAGVRDYFGRLSNVLDEQRVASVDIIDIDDDHLVAVVQGFATGPHFGAEVAVNWAWLIAMKDGKASVVKTFTDRGQALEAAGLSE